MDAEALNATDASVLAERIRSGDRSAEEALVTSYYHRVHLMLLARTQNLEAARDLTQDVFVALIDALRRDRLHHPEMLEGFIRGTARNMANSFLRSREIQRRQVFLTPEAAVPARDNDVEIEELLALLRLGLKRLHPVDREILRLILVEGISPSVIGVKLGLSTEAVRQRKSRAVRVLREYMKSETHPRHVVPAKPLRARQLTLAEGSHEL